MQRRDLRGAMTGVTAVRRVHLADTVFDQVAEMIVSGELAPGASLPPERELAERFDVSRLLVRQAVHRLAEIGLVKVRQGGASTACDPATAAHPTVAVLALRFSPARRDHLLQLFERQVLAAYPLLVLAELAIDRAAAVDLGRIVDEHERAPADLADFEERFWTRVADIGKNDFYRRDVRFWFSVVRSEPRAHHPAFGEPAQRIAIYREIVRRLERREDAAGAYMNVARMALEALRAVRASEL